MAPQLANYKRMKQRIRRTLNHGTKASRSLHLPLTEMMVEYFNQTSPFDYLKPETSASISSSGFADTCALVVALCYLERMRSKNKELFEASNPAEMYVPALVLASKYLHDSDQDERVSEEDWADMAGYSKKELSRLEWSFVEAIDWDVGVDEEEFKRRLALIESWVCSDFLSKYSFGTYNELDVVSSSLSDKLLDSLRMFVSALGLSLLLYSATVASLLSVPLAFPSTSSPSSSNASFSPVSQPLVPCRSLPTVPSTSSLPPPPYPSPSPLPSSSSSSLPSLPSSIPTRQSPPPFFISFNYNYTKDIDPLPTDDLLSYLLGSHAMTEILV